MWKLEAYLKPPSPERAKSAGLWFARLWLILAVLAGLRPSPAARAQAQRPDLPPGPVQQKARTACAECHDARILLQQRLERKIWIKEIDKMVRWGALVDSQDRDAFIDYFSSNFGPDKPPYMPERLQPARNRTAKPGRKPK